MPAMEAVTKAFAYDPETGELTWKEARGSLPAGRRAGTPTSGGYNVKFLGSYTAAHRIIWHIMTGEWPPHPVRHINGDKLDNRWGNLEVRLPVRLRDKVTRKPIDRERESVSAHGITRRFSAILQRQVWDVNVIVSGKAVRIGRFHSEDEAKRAFQNATGQGLVPHTL